jgi:hypothetical protein
MFDETSPCSARDAFRFLKVPCPSRLQWLIASALFSKAHLSAQFAPASIGAHRIEDRIEVVFRQPRISRLPR